MDDRLAQVYLALRRISDQHLSYVQLNPIKVIISYTSQYNTRQPSTFLQDLDICSESKPTFDVMFPNPVYMNLGTKE